MKKKQPPRHAQPRKLHKKTTPIPDSTEEQRVSVPNPPKRKSPDFSTTASEKENELINQESPKIKEQYEALNNKYQFLMAEYANYKKNNIKKLESIRKYEGQHLIHKLLTSVIDDFERAIEQDLTEQNMLDFKKGILMIYNKLKHILKEMGVKEIDCKGAPFDPAIHCALDSVANEDIPPEHIVYVIKKAYFFHDKLIRPAEVIVSQKSKINTLEQNKDVNG